jgi:hypothetical protein
MLKGTSKLVDMGVWGYPRSFAQATIAEVLTLLGSKEGDEHVSV